MIKIPLYSSLPWLYYLILNVWLCGFFYTHPVSSQCLDDQMSLLLELKNSLTFSPDASDKLVGWNQSIDCCQWSGVECDSSNGRVISLDLSERNITGGLDNLSSLFHLQFLQRLNLGGNKKMQGEIPSAIGKLSSLTYLNLSQGNFSGQVPLEISQLVKLVILDISKKDPDFPDKYYGKLYMKRPNLATIVQNLTNMREIYLDYVNNSAMGNKWCQILSSSLPHLQVLSISFCDLRGQIHKSLLNLKHLSVINLDYNNKLTGPVPDFFTNFANLSKLSLLTRNTIFGTVPVKIFQIPTLRTLSLSSYSNLQGTLPEFSTNGSLEELFLLGINFSTPLTNSITNLTRLRSLDLVSCKFHGSIPSSIGQLERLEWLDLSNNMFDGSIPSSIGSLKLLYVLDLSSNKFNGSIPSSIGSLDLLDSLDLSDNQFEGAIPKSFFQLTKLSALFLSSLRLNVTVQLVEFLQFFKNLTLLDLSGISLSITDGSHVKSSFPQLQWLMLSSCNLHAIPEFLSYQTQLKILDLSSNHITGTIPDWMLGIQLLNLSYNHFDKLDPTLTLSNIPKLDRIDLHSNNLQGNFPLFFSDLSYLDCSNNNFTSVDPDIGNYMSSTTFISFSNNSLHGDIPTSLCNATTLEFLNLESNSFGGKIPDCLLAMPQLSVLILRRNSLGGEIPDKFSKDCILQTLQLNENFLHGQIPQSLARCKPLRVLDLRNNQLYDTFPCHLKSLSNLNVVILRSNKFYGTIGCLKGHSIWPLLQIVDLASNHFSGDLSALFSLSWKMVVGESVEKLKLGYLESNSTDGRYYRNSVTVTTKGLQFELKYILTIFSSIDISSNGFHGELPIELGNLNALKVLNLSHNLLSGQIPPTIGNLSQIESLDFSCNTFSGKIPPQLANLNFLGYLNLSFNKLSGKIPTGPQLQTFDVSSYEGNQGLYGPPLTPFRLDPNRTPPSSPQGSNWSSKSQIDWMLRGTEVGFPVGLTIFLGPILYIKSYREWYCKHLHRLVMKISRKEDNPRGRRRRSKQPRQRH